MVVPAVSELDRLIAEQARDARSFRVFRSGDVSLDAIGDGAPARLTVLVSDPVHGTPNGYGNHRCRCDRCREAWRDYQRDWQRRRRARFYAQGLTALGEPRKRAA